MGEDEAVPLHPPKQDGGTFVIFACSTAGAEIENNEYVEHAFASVTVNVCEPVHNPVAAEVVAPPGFHKYVYAPVPPLTLALAVPLHPPEQLAFVEVTETEIAVGCVMATVFEEAHPFASVTVAWKFPGQSPVIAAVVLFGVVFHK